MKKEHFKGINLAYIAEKMGKSKSWLYQRINGSKVNGKEAKFTTEQLKLLRAKLIEFNNEVSTLIGNIKTDEVEHVLVYKPRSTGPSELTGEKLKNALKDLNKSKLLENL